MPAGISGPDAVRPDAGTGTIRPRAGGEAAPMTPTLPPARYPVSGRCSRCSLDTRLSLLSSVVVKDLSWLKPRARVTG